jgi:hypothetical protein
MVGAKDADEARPHDQVFVTRQIVAGSMPIPYRPGVAEVEGWVSADASRQPESVDNLIV